MGVRSIAEDGHLELASDFEVVTKCDPPIDLASY